MRVGAFLTEGRRRRLSPFWANVVTVLVMVLAAVEIYAAPFWTMDPYLLRTTFVGLVLATSFLYFTFSAHTVGDRVPLVDVALAGLSLGASTYILWHGDRIVSRWTGVDPMGPGDIFWTATLVLLVLEVTRRTVGPVLVAIILAFVAYTFTGQYLPGSFGHRGMSLVGFLDRMSYTFDGIFAAPVGVTCTYVYMFVLFGQVFNRAGGGDFFFRLASAVAGRMQGGPAKIAVLASGLYGSVSGSPTSDVVTTGSMTIPLMTRLGYSPVFAGAVEAAASSGASILPPIMGTAAFLMVDIAGIPYAEIAVAAMVPALIYYFGIMLQVHYRSITKNLRPLAGDEPREKAWAVLKENWLYLIPLGTLVWLITLRLNPTVVGLAASGVTVAVSWFRPGYRMGPRAVAETLHRTGTGILTVANASAAAGLVIGGIMLTGLGGKFTSLVFAATGGNGFLCVLMVAFVCILLGMGMPIPAAYVLTATLAVPALMELKFPLLSSHLFIVYFSALSAITPPVAVAAYAAAGISGASPNATGFQAVRLAIAAYLVPLVFLYRPGLLLRGSLPEILWAVAVTLVAVWALAGALEGYLYTRLPRTLPRLWVGAGGLLLIWPDPWADVTGLTLVGTLTAWQVAAARRQGAGAWRGAASETGKDPGGAG
ncbi:MAG: TRAP transporter permease [Deferrisomatales bacterium]